MARRLDTIQKYLKPSKKYSTKHTIVQLIVFNSNCLNGYNPRVERFTLNLSVVIIFKIIDLITSKLLIILSDKNRLTRIGIYKNIFRKLLSVITNRESTVMTRNKNPFNEILIN
jgi:hypothetical protein